MILVDTSVWIDHLRTENSALLRLLDRGAALIHPFVIGELSLGHLQHRRTVLETLSLLPQAVVASHEETLTFIDRHRLFGMGIGYVDAHLLGATCLTPGAALWTLDQRLAFAADRVGIRANFVV